MRSFVAALTPTRSWLLLLIVGTLLLAGCARAYRNMPLYEARVLPEMGSCIELEAGYHQSYHSVAEPSPNVQDITRITHVHDPLQPGEFAISPDGEWVVAQVLDLEADRPRANMWRLSTRGGATATQMTTGGYLDLDPVFDRTGKHLYFASNRSSDHHSLWRVSTTGAGGIARITSGTAMDRWPNLEPGGNHVYYTSRPENSARQQIWRIGTAGNLPTQMQEGWRPRVSPDGSKVLFCVQDEQTQRSAIWVTDIDGSHQTQLSPVIDADQRDPSWSPDGQKILYSSNEGQDARGRNNFDIWVMNADGTQPIQLTTNGSADLRPAFSPTGDAVYFLSNRGFRWDLWRMQVSTQ